jgi:hypothetical protein
MEKVLLEKITVPPVVTKFSFTEPEDSLPYSQECTNGPHPEPDQSSPHLPPCFPKIHSNIIFSSMPRSSEWPLPFGFTCQNFVCISHFSKACHIPCLYHAPFPKLYTQYLSWYICTNLIKIKSYVFYAGGGGERGGDGVRKYCTEVDVLARHTSTLTCVTPAKNYATFPLIICNALQMQLQSGKDRTPLTFLHIQVFEFSLEAATLAESMSIPKSLPHPSPPARHSVVMYLTQRVSENRPLYEVPTHQERHRFLTVRVIPTGTETDVLISTRDSSVGIATGYELHDRGSRVRFVAGTAIFYTTVSRPALGPIQTPIQWAPGAFP